MRSNGLEVAASRGILEVETAATGTNWAQLPEVACNQVVIYNETGVELRWRYCTPVGVDAGSGTDLPIADGAAQPVRGINNANQVQVKRSDDSNTQVTAGFVHEGV